MTVPTGNLSKYRPSGRLSPRTIPVVLLIGIPVALISGWAYAKILDAGEWIPLSILICVFVGTVIALCIAGVFKYSRSRSPIFNKYGAGTLAFVMVWSSWIVTLLEQGMAEAAADFAASGPLGWTRIIVDYTTRLQTVLPDPLAWPLLAIGWLMETLFLVSFTSTLARIPAEDAFSEIAGATANKDFEGELFWQGGSHDALLPLLQENGASALLHFDRAADLIATLVASQWWTLKVTGKSVAADTAARWVDLDILIHERDEKGRISSRSIPLIDSMCVSNDDYAAMAALLKGEKVDEVSSTLISGVSAHENQTADSRPTPIELAAALSALKAENYGSAIVLAKPHCQHPSDNVRADAYRLCALAHAKLMQWQDAFGLYHRLFELEPTAFNAIVDDLSGRWPITKRTGLV